MRRRVLSGISAVAIVSFGLTGCATLITDTGSAGLDDVTVAVEPLIGAAAVYLGVRHGYFEDEGIDLTINSLPSTSDAVVEMVGAGHAHFGLSDTLTLMAEHAAGAPVMMLSGAYASSSNPRADFAALVVKEDSAIRTMTDIQGKNVSSPDPRSLDETVVRGLIDDAGGDPAGVRFIKVAPSGTIAALESDEVDVAFLVEPYLSWAVESGHRVLSYPYVDYVENLTVAAYFTSTELATAEPELVTRFAAAIKKSLALAQNNPIEARNVFANYTTTVEETRASLFLPRYTAVIDRASLTKLGATAARHGILIAEPDLKTLLP